MFAIDLDVAGAGGSDLVSVARPSEPDATMNTSNELSPESSTQNGAASGNDGPDRAGNVDKIRDILFGSQMRDYDKKFARLEDRLIKESADLREELKRRFASLESFMKSEVEALNDRQKTETTARGEALKEAADKLAESARAAERRAAQMEEQHAKAQRDLRQLVLEETKRLAEEIGQKHSAIATELGRESQELRGMLTDKYALSDLFAELALRLKNEFKFPAE
jgi:hypothetical protein